MKPYYECHVTFVGDQPTGQALVTAIGWKYSCIDGDPVLGDGVRQYATMLYNSRRSQEEIWGMVQHVRTLLNNHLKLRVTRCKIERVVRDEQYKEKDVDPAV